MEQIIFHIDVNSAYLSWTAVEQLKNGAEVDLRKIPAIIGGNQESRHGVVLAKSPLAKKYGIRTGEPVAQAFRKCPDLVMAPPNHKMYQEYSRRLMEFLQTYTPDIEQVSVDECFMDFTGISYLYLSPVEAAFEIKDAVYEKFGFTVNIGISVNHLLAKMASDFEKPNRVHTLFPEEMAAKFWPLPVESLYGCGKTTAKRLRSLGITTIGALAKADRQMLLSNFKSQGDYLWESANGISSSAVTAESPANKGYGNSVTLPYDVTDTENAHHILLSLCETVGARIRYDKAYISVVQVQIVDNDFHHRCKQLSLPSATNVTEKIYEAACNAFDQGWDHAPIRLLGVSTSKATDESYEQYNLFDQDKFERLSKLNSAIDKIRDKYGDDAIVRACFADTHKN